MLAKNFVVGKLMNQANFLKLLAKNRKPTDRVLAEKIYEAGRAVGDVVTRMDTVKMDEVDEKR